MRIVPLRDLDEVVERWHRGERFALKIEDPEGARFLREHVDDEALRALVESRAHYVALSTALSIMEELLEAGVPVKLSTPDAIREDLSLIHI